MKSMLAVAASLVLLAAALTMAAPVAHWPGYQGPALPKTDAGYITVDEAHDRRIFYVFVEAIAPKVPTEVPLVIWLTGGPGCSGMYGLFTEHGPFYPNFTDQGHGLKYNPYTWANEANIIYIESPAGVGFSSSNVTSDYSTGDRRTATDSYNFIQGFLGRFPQFRGNDFWVVGESYGGHYVPELVHEIQTQNKKASSSMQINIKGMMAGNPWTDPELEAFGVVENWWNRAIVSRASYDQILNNCDYQDITFWIINNVSAGGEYHAMQNILRDRLRKNNGYSNYFTTETGLAMTEKRQICFNALHETSQVQFGGVDILGVYLDVCNKGTNGAIPDQPNWCANQQMTQYLNLPEVQAALHVSAPLPNRWEPCSAKVHYNFTDTKNSVRWIYEEVLNHTDLKVLVYSGDQDAIVPFTGTRKWIHSLGRPIVNDTHQWWSDTNGEQVGGWAVQYDRFTFTTVRNAGHMVPFAQPQRALHMFREFLKNGKL